MIGLMIIAIIGISIAIATIDTGYMNDALHGGSAVVGFGFFYISMIGITYNYTKILEIYPNFIS